MTTTTMTTPTLRGLNWGHRRATGPLAAVAERVAAEIDGLRIDWRVQPLSGFEHGLSAAVVDAHDLVVFDHPFCGAILRDGLLQPLDEVAIGLDDADFVGRSLDSYRYGGRLWAVPIDGATQVALARPDLLPDDAPLPERWDEVLALGESARRKGKKLGLALASPHGALVAMALCANRSAPWSADPWSTPFDRAVMVDVLGSLRALLPCLPEACRDWNAIDLHEAMVASDDIVYAPLAYGYGTYGEADMRRRLAFGPFPGPNGPAGAVLGGTGLGITRSCRDLPRAKALASLFARADIQRAFAASHGQPAHVAAWHDAEIDHRFGGFFAATRKTTERSWLRPRFFGWIPIQAACGDIVAAFARGDRDIPGTVAALERVWWDAMPVFERAVSEGLQEINHKLKSAG